MANDKRLSKSEARQQRKQLGRSAAPPEPIDDKPFMWSVDDIDHDYKGEWDWDLAPKETADLLHLLASTSGMTWRQIKALKTNSRYKSHPLHHGQPVDSICKEAQDRLSVLRLDLEDVFRLRHGNLTRVWGHLQGSVFRIVWYDRAHKVCPSEK
ncbi:hypothetical protein [Mycobacteroides abscessus]|uniref:hypothetical protein n=1 Tax=Mycobacteroides abscessus TaxID=36809 RepID=UPI0002585749|nr:hypothetical protein [Mycobacteroides abscessus]EIC65354.1 hypothetical protein S7W_18715 [Mycobacteroides abscessus M94]SKZ81101.1 Uncharacterised protein [Mycobacteroides abscessus subsp. abscessus]